jgi:hypothetical protein
VIRRYRDYDIEIACSQDISTGRWRAVARVALANQDNQVNDRLTSRTENHDTEHSAHAVAYVLGQFAVDAAIEVATFMP